MARRLMRFRPRFPARLPNVFTIPKTSRAERAIENASAADIHLNAAEIALIDAQFPRGAATANSCRCCKALRRPAAVFTSEATPPAG